jgi:AcrR family transcriptional regulator
LRHPKRRPVDQEEALASAADVAVELGLHAVSLPAVAARLGVHRRTVERMWPSAEALVAMTFSRIVGAELAEVQGDVLGHASPVEQLAELLASLAEPVPYLDSLWVESWSLGRRNRALGAAVRTEELAWHTLVASVVRSGIESGDFTADDPDEVATHLLAVIDGVNAYSLVGYDTEVNRLRLLHAVARTRLGVDLPGEVPQQEPDRAAS